MSESAIAVSTATGRALGDEGRLRRERGKRTGSLDVPEKKGIDWDKVLMALPMGGAGKRAVSEAVELAIGAAGREQAFSKLRALNLDKVTLREVYAEMRMLEHKVAEGFEKGSVAFYKSAAGRNFAAKVEGVQDAIKHVMERAALEKAVGGKAEVGARAGLKARMVGGKSRMVEE